MGGVIRYTLKLREIVRDVAYLVCVKFDAGAQAIDVSHEWMREVSSLFVALCASAWWVQGSSEIVRADAC